MYVYYDSVKRYANESVLILWCHLIRKGRNKGVLTGNQSICTRKEIKVAVAPPQRAVLNANHDVINMRQSYGKLRALFIYKLEHEKMSFQNFNSKLSFKSFNFFLVLFNSKFLIAWKKKVDQAHRKWNVATHQSKRTGSDVLTCLLIFLNNIVIRPINYLRLYFTVSQP